MFSATTAGIAADIASTTDRIFINDDTGDILQFSSTTSPFTATYSTTYSFPSLYLATGLAAIDNNYLLAADDYVHRVNLSANSLTTLFTITGACTGDILYNLSLDQYVISRTDGGLPYVTIYNSTGGEVSTIDLSPYISDPNYPEVSLMYGLGTYNNKIYGITYSMYIYELNFNTNSISLPIQPANLSGQKCIGCTIPTIYVSWT